jgi:hypothetical protein
MASKPVPRPTPRKLGRHGDVRGLSRISRSALFEGRFGRMFRALPPAGFTESDIPALVQLAGKMTAAVENPPTPETQTDDEENTRISAGYTYFGQFIDHDLTFDPASSLQKQDDPDALTDYRTPRFDLDNLYGRGPDDEPYLYRDDGKRFLLGHPLMGNDNDNNARDVPRNSPVRGERARAIIGDPRDDENVIISQLQASMLRFHNRMVDVLGDGAPFEEIQQSVRWHYQWVILHDFLPTIIGEETWHSILPHIDKKTTVLETPPRLKFFLWRNEVFIPVEFSVAAYRFGHSMVRPIYRLNTTMERRLTIFPDLEGFEPFAAKQAIDWRLFFKVGNPPKLGPNRVQPAYKIDTSLVNPLGHLPAIVAHDASSLPARNLIRGFRMSLPSGQEVARFMGEKPIDDADLKIGKATEADTPTNKPLVDLSPVFKGNAPLWFYVLAEAQQQFKKDDTGIHLGSVGGRIVGEVIVGLLMADNHSFLRRQPDFQPRREFQSKGQFKISDLLHQATLAEPQP